MTSRLMLLLVLPTLAHSAEPLAAGTHDRVQVRSEEHTSELQSQA